MEEKDERTKQEQENSEEKLQKELERAREEGKSEAWIRMNLDI